MVFAVCVERLSASGTLPKHLQNGTPSNHKPKRYIAKQLASHAIRHNCRRMRSVKKQTAAMMISSTPTPMSSARKEIVKTGSCWFKMGVWPKTLVNILADAVIKSSTPADFTKTRSKRFIAHKLNIKTQGTGVASTTPILLINQSNSALNTTAQDAVASLLRSRGSKY